MDKGQQEQASSASRLTLLKAALASAKAATEHNPHSLSSAALRATLVVNVLVEESSLFSDPQEGQQQAAEAIKQEIAAAIDACSRAAEAPIASRAEPAADPISGQQTASEPAGLPAEQWDAARKHWDAVLDQWVQDNQWELVVQEKRHVLLCMQQVLQSCYTLLCSTQIPLDGVVRLLQHILRSLLPQRQGQQKSIPCIHQLLPGIAAEASGLDAQLLLQVQQALLHQGQGQGLQQHPAELQTPTTSSPAAAVAKELSNTPADANAARAQASTSGNSIGSPLAAPAYLPPAQTSTPTREAPATPTFLPPKQKPPAGASTYPSPLYIPQSDVGPYEERDWDWELGGPGSGSSSTSKPTAATQAARRRGGRGKAGGSRPSAAAGGRAGAALKERSKQDRYHDVEAFWCSMQPAQRLELLKVPLAPVLTRMRSEMGQDPVEEVCMGLSLLQEESRLHDLRLWMCPICNQRFYLAKHFLQHIAAVHEEVAVRDGKYVVCSKCQLEVVGMYYTSTLADYNVCCRCFQEELANVPEASSGYERIFPHVPPMRLLNVQQQWTETGSEYDSREASSCSSGQSSTRMMGNMQALESQPGHGVGSAWAAAGPHFLHPHSQHVEQHVLGLPAWSLPAAYPAAHPPQQEAPHTAATSAGPAPACHSHSPAPCCTPPAAPNMPKSSSMPALHTPEPELASPPQAPTTPGSSGHTSPSSSGGHLTSTSGSHERGATSPVAGQEQAQPQQHSKQDWPASDHGIPHTRPACTATSSTAAGTCGAHNAAPTSAPFLFGAGSATSQPANAGLAGGSGLPHQRPCSCQPGLTWLTSSEAHQLLVVADEVMQRIREVYAANHPMGDVALGSVMQFTERKLSGVDRSILPREAPFLRSQLEEFLAQPACVFHKPDVLYAVLLCLPLGDLHKVLLYLRTQSSAAAAAAAASSAPGPAGASAGCAQTCNSLGCEGFVATGSSAGVGSQVRQPDAAVGASGHMHSSRDYTRKRRAARSLHSDEDQAEDDGDSGSGLSEQQSSQCECEGSDCSYEGAVECDEEDEDGDQEECEEGEEEEDEEGLDEEDEEEDEDEGSDWEPGPPPVLDLRAPNGGALQAVVSSVWQQGEDGGPQAETEDGAGTQCSTGQQVKGRGKRSNSSAGHVGLEDLLLMAGLRMEGAPSASMAASQQHPWLSPSEWWLCTVLGHHPNITPVKRHPQAASKSSKAQQDAAKADWDPRGSTRLLKWVYGKLVNLGVEDFQARQASFRSGREPGVALLDLFDDLAFSWRSLQAALDQRARLEELRKGARAQFAVVRHIEEEARHCHAEEAAEFLEVLLTSHQAALLSAHEPGAGSNSNSSAEQPRLNMCEAAVDVVRRHPALAGEQSQRYAKALLDRELAALLLVEAAVSADADEALRGRAAAEDTVRKHRAEVRDAETEQARLEAEGPPSHRKRDLLDKATKEAEHRERLQDLQSRISSLKERIATQEASQQKWGDRFNEAEADLKNVRSQLRLLGTRRRHLDELCAQLEMAMPPNLIQHQHGPTAAPAPAAPTVPFSDPSQPTPTGQPSLPTFHAAAQGGVITQAGSHPDALQVSAGEGGPFAPNPGPYSSPPMTLKDWQKQRLEVLMHRLMCVSEAVKTYQDRYSPHARTRHYELFLKATSWAKSMADEYESQVQGWYAQLERVRERLVEQATLDLGLQLAPHVLELMRRRIEAAACLAQEQASLSLLQELEQEASQQQSSSAAAGQGTKAGGPAASKKQARADKAREKKDKEEVARLAREADEARRHAAEAAAQQQQQRLADARAAREAAIEAELESRRLELEALEAKREAEAIRAAQEASLKEAAQAAAQAAAAAAAQACAPGLNAAASMKGSGTGPGPAHKRQPQPVKQQVAGPDGPSKHTAPIAAGPPAAHPSSRGKGAAPLTAQAPAATPRAAGGGLARAAAPLVPARTPPSVLGAAQAGGGSGQTKSQASQARSSQVRAAGGISPKVLPGIKPATQPAKSAAGQAHSAAMGRAAAAAAAAPQAGAHSPRHAPKFTPSGSAAATAPAPVRGAPAAVGAAARPPPPHLTAAAPVGQGGRPQQHSARTSTAGPASPRGPPQPSAMPGVSQPQVAAVSQALQGQLQGMSMHAAHSGMPVRAAGYASTARNPAYPLGTSLADDPTPPPHLQQQQQQQQQVLKEQQYPHPNMQQQQDGPFHTAAWPATVQQRHSPLSSTPPVFNPFAENPLLRALQPERTSSPAPSPMHNALDALSLGLAAPSGLLQPGGAATSLVSTAPTSPVLCSPDLLQGTRSPLSFSSPTALSGAHMSSPGSLTQQGSTATPEPATEHILNIMSLLEPEGQHEATPTASSAKPTLATSPEHHSPAPAPVLGESTGRGMSSLLVPPAGAYNIWSNDQQGGFSSSSWGVPTQALGGPQEVGRMHASSRTYDSGSSSRSHPLVFSTLSSAAPPWTGGAVGAAANCASLPLHSQQHAYPMDFPAGPGASSINLSSMGQGAQAPHTQNAWMGYGLAPAPHPSYSAQPGPGFAGATGQGHAWF